LFRVSRAIGGGEDTVLARYGTQKVHALVHFFQQQFWKFKNARLKKSYCRLIQRYFDWSWVLGHYGFPCNVPAGSRQPVLTWETGKNIPAGSMSPGTLGHVCTHKTHSSTALAIIWCAHNVMATILIMLGIDFFRGDATAPPARGNRIIVHLCNDGGIWEGGALSERWLYPELCYCHYAATFAKDGLDMDLGAVQLLVDPRSGTSRVP
jgi:hypothetical protein